MRIAIMGSGGVGGYYGGLLARAGHDVTFIARGEHLQAIREHGLQVQSVHGDFSIHPASATDTPADVGAVDLIIVAVKMNTLEDAAEQMRPLVDGHTSILPLQNGVEAAARLSQIFGQEAVMGGATWIVSMIAEPGVIRQASQVRRIVFGEIDGRETERAKTILKVLQETGANIELSNEIEKVLWGKLMLIASFSGITSMTRSPIGPVLAFDESRSLFEAAMRETETVAHAHGILLDSDAVAKAMTFAATLDPELTSSMQRDVVAGRHSEFDALNGAIMRAGREVDVATPIHSFIWTCIKIIEESIST